MVLKIEIVYLKLKKDEKDNNKKESKCTKSMRK